jgi:alkylation response protein AidB-like acyl-CoA dehydrogenase
VARARQDEFTLGEQARDETGLGFGFEWSRDDHEFRTELREFLADNRPGPSPEDRDDRLAWKKKWAALLVDSGYGMPSWPRRFGGMEVPLSQQLIYHDEFAQARVPSHPSPRLGIIGATLIRHGTPAQQERFLRPMLRADEIWAQGFSEPNAGSDLASLQTRAERVGDEYVLNGQKVWTSQARSSQWMFALVRTAPPETRHRGITFLLVPMDSPGVTVRPLQDLTGLEGSEEFAEVFLADVRVPVANRVGEENEGWRIARTSLGHERSTNSFARAIRYRRIVDDLIELARRQGLTADAGVRQQLAWAEQSVRILRINSMRTLSALFRGEEPGPSSSIDRLYYSLFEQRLHEVAVTILGPYGMLAPDDDHNVESGRWSWGFLRTRASTIGAGTAEVQRNILADAVLGLPGQRPRN